MNWKRRGPIEAQKRLISYCKKVKNKPTYASYDGSGVNMQTGHIDYYYMVGFRSGPSKMIRV